MKILNNILIIYIIMSWSKTNLLLKQSFISSSYFILNNKIGFEVWDELNYLIIL